MNKRHDEKAKENKRHDNITASVREQRRRWDSGNVYKR